MSRLKIVETNKPDRFVQVVRNVDAGSISSISTIQNVIPAGAPVILNLSATPQPSTYINGMPPGVEDGLQVCLPSSALNNANMSLGSALAIDLLHYGVATAQIQFGQLGETLVHGVFPFALVTRATRSATTASWATVATLAGGQLLAIDATNNAYQTIGSTNASNALSYAPVILLDSLASVAGSASATSDTRTAILTQQRVFVREM